MIASTNNKIINFFIDFIFFIVIYVSMPVSLVHDSGVSPKAHQLTYIVYWCNMKVT